ncbi:nucleoside 2-deoxyribosyltransferase [Chitinophaga defluvii]|uniref:Nucleoside 2-deoxyribosyltransferase n=1 Tax=Chitinophaga defluvii TaxID=3163343 RepID=A0ABV2T032_9BACT
MTRKKICLIGDILVDVTLKTLTTDVKLRMGGIVHAARTLWSLDIPFGVAYFAPSYLDNSVFKYLNSLGCQEITKLGNVVGSPYVFLISEAKETGDQGYEFLLRDEIQIEYDESAYEKIRSADYTDYLLISGNYDMINLIGALNGQIHVDVANNIGDISFFNKLSKKLSSIFVSTSSNLFKSLFENNLDDFFNQFQDYTDTIILKENRGGSRGLDFIRKESAFAPSQTRPIMHSVGVGDAYFAACVVKHNPSKLKEAMILSSWIAAEYAGTTFPDDFKNNVTRILKSNLVDLTNLGGTFLPWEIRKKINIYIAAPDFDFIDTTPINKLVENLIYHNFTPRRPIKENGQMEVNATKARRQELFAKDMVMLSECSVLIGVLLYDDPGTLLEIGWAAAKGIPSIVYDPFNRATNCMLTELPDVISSDLDVIISEVFIKSSNIFRYGK